jgi:C-terminal processing protease CtpA/Prc
VVVLDVLGIDIDRYRSLGDTLSEPELMKDGRDFRFIGDIAYLRPGAFMSLSSSKLSEKETRGNTEFLSFLESAFTEIASSNCDHLIVDIRGNPGGSSSFSNPMIAYFADRQFHETSSLDIRTSRITKKSWREIEDPTLADLKQEILTRRDGERWSEVAEPYPPRNDELSFTGQVYGLIDRFS